jgi:hypothetical protein
MESDIALYRDGRIIGLPIVPVELTALDLTAEGGWASFDPRPDRGRGSG